MKSIVKKLAIISILASVFTASIFAATAEVISVKGKVEVSRGDNWIQLKVGDKVNESEVISTGFQSEAKIKMGDSILQLGALSRVTLATLSSNNSKDVVDVYLNTGAVRSKVNHTSDKKVNYTVRNPIAVASVRGTEFSFSDNGSVSCTEGAVALAPTSSYTPDQLASGKSADDVEDPADGESNATTSANDIAPDSPAGTIVVGAGQGAQITETGKTTTPLQSALNNIKGTSFGTAADEEAITTSSFAAINSGKTESAKLGSILVNISVE